MTISAKVLGALEFLCKVEGVSAATAAGRLKISPKTAQKYARCDFKFVKAERRVSPKIRRRRTVLAKLAQLKKKVGYRQFPRHASSTSLRSGLFKATGELISARHVRREMRSCGFRSYRRTKVPTRTPKDVAKREAFARRQLKSKRLPHIVFSDETWLSTNESTGAAQWARSKKDVIPLERKARWNVASVLVWAAVGVGYKSPLIIFPPNKEDAEGELRTFRLDHKSYIRRCLSKVSGDLVRRKKVFQQDGARSHVHWKVMQYFEKKKVDVLEDWPPYSPDLNMIESVWNLLARRVGDKCPGNMEELLKCAKEAWDEIPQVDIDHHVLHFRNALKKVLSQ